MFKKSPHLANSSEPPDKGAAKRMRMFDALPPKVRRAVSQSQRDFSVKRLKQSGGVGLAAHSATGIDGSQRSEYLPTINCSIHTGKQQ